MSKQRTALVVGLGIAGMSTAIRLQDAGWEPILIERAPERRTGGYMVGMFPEGIAAAERLGVNGDIVKRTQADGVALQVDTDGTHTPGPGFTDQPGSPETVLRGDIEAGLWRRIEGRIEVRFDTAPVSIEQDDAAARVSLRVGSTGVVYQESFDLVVGADGMRSTVRALVFGPHEQFMKSMDAMICAYQMSGQLPGFADHESLIAADPKRALWVFAMEGTEPTALFTYRTKDVDAQFTRPRAEVLAEAYAGMSAGGAVPAAIAEFEAAPQSLFDSVHQVRMPSWHTGRVVLVGDAAWCLTLYSGMGATAGMLGGAALGDALATHPDNLEAALGAYEAEMRPFITKHQRTAALKSQLFVPSGRVTWWLRRQMLKNARLLAFFTPAKTTKANTALVPA